MQLLHVAHRSIYGVTLVTKGGAPTGPLLFIVQVTCISHACLHLCWDSERFLFVLFVSFLVLMDLFSRTTNKDDSPGLPDRSPVGAPRQAVAPWELRKAERPEERCNRYTAPGYGTVRNNIGYHRLLPSPPSRQGWHTSSTSLPAEHHRALSNGMDGSRIATIATIATGPATDFFKGRQLSTHLADVKLIGTCITIWIPKHSNKRIYTNIKLCEILG